MSLQGTKILVGLYVALSWLTLAAVILLRDHHDIVNDAVLVRVPIVALSSLLTFWFATQAARGVRRGLLRLRIVALIMLVAIVVIVSLSGTFPLWLRIEQGVCGVLLLGVLASTGRARVRAAVAAK
jgi:hypothetical protein